MTVIHSTLFDLDAFIGLRGEISISVADIITAPHSGSLMPLYSLFYRGPSCSVISTFIVSLCLTFPAS